MNKFSLAAAAAAALALAACTTSRDLREGVVMNVPSSRMQDIQLESRNGDEACYTENGPIFRGGLHARECVLRNIMRASERSMHAAPGPAIDDIRLYSTQLAGFYSIRAERQQSFMDRGAGITQFAGIGALLSEPVGAATQTIWLQVAFAPIFASAVNAHEPTRELFYAGSLGLDLINMRYLQLEQRAEAFAAYESAGESENCASTGALISRAAALSDAADKSVLQGEAERLMASCLAIAVNAQEMELVRRSIAVHRRQWAAHYASDIIELDRLLLHKDQQFRYSPRESFGAIAASPFRALGTLLSGQDAEAAIKKIETAIAFEGMVVRLEPVRLPERRELAAAVSPLSPSAIARRAATSNAAARTLVTDLQLAANALQNAQVGVAQRAASLGALYDAAASTHLSFTYVASNNIVTVELGAPPRPTPAETTRSTPPAN